MHEFFRPLRRRLGVVTLALACGFMTLWVRSLSALDRITIVRQGIIGEYLVSQDSGCGWMKEVDFNLLSAGVLTDAPYREWCGFKYGMKLIPQGPVCKVNFRMIPYWSLVIPLTLLSAWLLLSKPRAET